MIQPYLDPRAKQTRLENLTCEDGSICYGDFAITLDDLVYMISDVAGCWNDLDAKQQERIKSAVNHVFQSIACEAVFETCLACGRDDEEVCNQCRTSNLIPAIHESSPLDIYLNSVFSN